MANNTTNENNETGGNVTELLESVEESGLLDSLMDDPVLLALAALVLGLGAYIAYTVPAVKALVFKYLKNNEAELMSLLDKHLTETQMKAYEKLDEAAQKHVKDSLVRNVLLTAWDEHDDKLTALVKSEVKSALAEGKAL
jgi:flagellar motor component MotA